MSISKIGVDTIRRTQCRTLYSMGWVTLSFWLPLGSHSSGDPRKDKSFPIAIHQPSAVAASYSWKRNNGILQCYPFLETNLNLKLIPCACVSKVGLSNSYSRNTQNAGVMGRPKNLPFQSEVRRHLNHFLDSQQVKAGQIPKLSKPLSFPCNTIDRIDSADASALDELRQKKWKKYQTSQAKGKITSRQSLKEIRPPDEKPTVLGFKKNYKKKLKKNTGTCLM